MEDEWKANIMSAVDTCDATRLDKLLTNTMDSSKLQLTLDFSARTVRNRNRWFYICFGYATPLSLAVSKGYKRIAEQLLCAGAKVDFVGTGSTPLMLAARGGRKDICLLLLDYGADVNLQEHTRKYTALFYAALNGNPEVVNLLLDHGAEINNSNHGLEDSVLGVAIASQCPRTTQILLAHSVKINVHVPLGLLFKLGFKYGSEKCLMVILRQGYHPMQQEAKERHSFFCIAARFGLIKLICLLLELNPQYMQEEWLLKEDYPYRLTQHSDFISWLSEYRKHPLSLVKMCKSTILAQLGSYYTTQVKQLPLPSALRTLLMTLESAYDQD